MELPQCPLIIRVYLKPSLLQLMSIDQKAYLAKTSNEKKAAPTNHLQIDNINLETFENAQVTEKKAEASIWLGRNFPMKFDVSKVTSGI